MAAVIKAVNAKIRSNKVLDYVCSTRMCALSLKRVLWNIPGRRPGRRPKYKWEKGGNGGNTEPTRLASCNRGKKSWTCRC